MSVIFQDYIKYELSLKENISLGNIKELNNKKLVYNALEKIGGDNFKSIFPNNIDTQLGVWFNDGVQISGGQWQKISLMRAFYRNADCYILDEPNSALDPVTENEIFEKIQVITDNKIGFLITHRMMNISKFSSRVLVLKNGELVGDGKHSDLIEKNEYYNSVYTSQFLSIKTNEELEIAYV